MSQESDIDSVYSLGTEILVFAKTEMNSPNKIQVINKEFIKKINGNQLADVLKIADGVYVKDYGFNSGLKTLSVNSTQSEQTLLIYNGMRLNSRQNSYFDTGLLRLDDVASITISKGGSSALYGSDAIGGVINIITTGSEQTDKRKFGFESKAGIGSYGIKNIYGKISYNSGKNYSFYASYLHEASDNKYEYNYYNGFSNVLKARENSDYKNHFANINANVRLSKNSIVNWFAIYSYWNRGLPGIETGYNSSTSRQIDRDVITSVNLNSKSNGNINYSGNLGFRYSLMSYFDTATYSFVNPINSFYKLRVLSHTGIISIRINNKTETKVIYEGSYTDFLSNETERGKSFQAGLSVNFQRSFDIQPIKRLTIFPSLRYDYYSNLSQPHIVTGKIGVNLQPFKKANFALKGSIGNNFRVPSFNDMYWNGLGSKTLRPEKSVSIDAGFIYSFIFFAVFETEASYFQIRTIDRILWSPGAFNIWRPDNIGEVISQGTDLSVKAKLNLNKNFEIHSGINFNISESKKTSKDSENDPTYNKQLIYIPKQQFKANLVINYLPTSKYLKSLSLTFCYNYAGKRYSNLENTVFAPYYEVFDGNIQSVFKLKSIELGVKFSVNNILKSDYQVVSGYPMPLGNINAEISIKY